MEDGQSLFIAGSLNINGGQFSQVDEELDEEEEKQRELELQNKLKNAFDDLDEDSFQDHSSFYSENHRSSVSKGDTNRIENEPQDHSSYDKSYSNQPASLEEDYCHSPISENDHAPPWSDESDLSGNFVAQNSLIQSPTRFHINVENVVSHSDDSVSVGRCKDDDFHEFSENLGEKALPQRRKNEIIQADYLSAETSYKQLQLLYEARGREIDRMSDELAKIQNFSHNEISSLKNELAIMKADKETLSISKDQLKHLLSESELRIRDFVAEIKNKDIRIEHLENENKNLKLQVSTAQGTITSLEKQVSDIQSIDSITKSHQVHEEFLKKLQSSHHQEVEELKRRLKSSSEKIEDYKLQINRLEDDLATLHKSKETALLQKAEDIRQLNSNLEAAQQQIKLLFDSKSSHSPNKEEDAKAICKENESLKQELQRVKTDLESYELLVKCGLLRSLSSSYNESIDQLSLCRAINFDEKIASCKLKPNNSSKGELTECNTGISEKLHKEFLKSLNYNKTYRKEVEQLRKTVSEKETLIKVLETQLVSLKDKIKQNASTYNDKNVNSFIEENTYLKKEIYSLIQNKEELMKKGEEMLTELEKLLLCPTIDFNGEKNSRALEVIKGCISLLKKQKNIRYQMWEELRDDNIRLNSKRYLVLDKFEALVKCLKEIKNDMKIKNLPNSSELVMLKQLTETFYFNVNDLKEEMSQYLSNSTKLKNEMWTVKLNLEECKDEIFNLKGKISSLEEENKAIENNKLQTIENCKENYLKFHEEAVSKLRNDLQAEYDTLYYSLKDEMEKLSEDLSEARKNYLEICSEKNQLEEMLQRNKSMENKNSEASIIEENKFLSKELIVLKKKCAHFEKENQNLKNQLEEILKSKLRESQDAEVSMVKGDNLLKKVVDLEGKCAIQEKENQMSSTHREGDVDLTDRENAQLTEAQQSIKDLKRQVQDLILEVDQLNAKLKEEKDFNKEGRNTPNYLDNNRDSKVDVSFSHILGTVENYKKLNEDYREQIKKQKLFYEEQIDRLKVQVEFYSTNDAFIPNEPKKQLEKNCEEVVLLSKKVEDLSVFLARTEAEKLELVKGHKEEVQKLMKDVHDHEKNLRDFKHNSEIHLMSLMKEIHELNYKKTEFENEVIKLKQARTQLVDKYSKLRNKFIKLKNNFDKYRTWSESRDAHFISEVDRITKLKTEENQSEFNSFKKWLGNCRSVLADGLFQVIDEMKSIPEKALPHSSLEPHIRALVVIHEGLSNLDIRDKNSVRTR